MSNSTKLAWGILATGGIAHAFARGLASSRTGKLVAVASRDQAKADSFAAEFAPTHGSISAHGSYESLLADPAVQVVYIATPHSSHAEWAIAAARAGKQVLCEKPMTMTAAEAEEVFRVATEQDVFVMEAFMYRCHPQTKKLVELVRSGTIGEVRQIQATFSFLTLAGVESRLINPALGGGGILDVGCYAMSMARLIAGVARGKSFAEPVELKAITNWELDGAVDSASVAIAKFPGDILAQLACGVRLVQENAVRIYGTQGSLVVPAPWVPSGEGGTTEIRIVRGSETEVIHIESDRSIYAHEADVVARSLAQSQRQAPEMSWDDTLGNMRALEEWAAGR